MPISLPAKTRRVLRSGDLFAAERELAASDLDDSSRRILLADVQRQSGDLAKARSSLVSVVPSTPALRILASRIEGEVLSSTGQVAAALDLLGRVVIEGNAAGEREQVALAALSRFTALASHRGLAESQHGLETAKKAVLACGDAQLMAALHARVGQAHAQRNLPALALAELRSALKLLELEPNAGVEAFTWLALSGAEYLLANNVAAADAARTARKIAADNGFNGIAASAQANLAFLECRRGRFTRARDLAEHSSASLPPLSIARGASADTLANVALVCDNLDDARKAVQTIEAIIAAIPGSTLLQVDTAASRAEVLRREGRISESHELLSAAITIAEDRGDTVSWGKLALKRAEVRVEAGLLLDANRDLVEVLERVSHPDAELLGLLARARAVLAAAERKPARAKVELRRAMRVFRMSGNLLRYRETKRTERFLLATQMAAVSVGNRKHRAFLDLAESITFVCGLLPQPRLAGGELVRLLRRLRLADAAELVRVASDEPLRSTDIEVSDSSLERLVVRTSPAADPFATQTIAHVRRLLRNALLALNAETESAREVLSWELDVDADGIAGVYVADSMRRLLTTIRKAAASDAPVLITGETGTGKEVVANELHASSPRAQKPFIPFNVTAVPREMLEGQLFGYRRGAFTGAVNDHKGLIRDAEGGTLFIDEIGELGADLQPKLLRFLESGEIQPLGERPQRVDVRIVAATNASLEHLVREGRFREDLFYRLNVIQLAIPPLRDRREEIPTLVHHFLARHARDAGKPIPHLSPQALECLSAYEWPGNVRQLTNELKRLVALTDEDDTIDVADLAAHIRVPPPPDRLVHSDDDCTARVRLDQTLQQMYDEIDRVAIPWALRSSRNNQRLTAQRLGLTRKGLYLKRLQYGLMPQVSR